MLLRNQAISFTMPVWSQASLFKCCTFIIQDASGKCLIFENKFACEQGADVLGHVRRDVAMFLGAPSLPVFFMHKSYLKLHDDLWLFGVLLETVQSNRKLSETLKNDVNLAHLSTRGHCNATNVKIALLFTWIFCPHFYSFLVV
ncbi:hypothetical protein L596_024575 [Steinernema carpocapsae]|uniref:Uncharacterized protein n=1 Tax=Steinernema carpocapsae TaxID=34508 RepID=A0A4V5ZZT0_STECR|nr:hypothetical protein L596_024575 [Steinernema carpocapsae]